MSAVQVHPSIYRINAPFEGGGAVQSYLLLGSKRALVDTGVSYSPDESIEPALRAMDLSLGDVDVIVNTHGHADHLGGNARVKEASGAPVMIHRDDVPFTQNPRANFELPTTVPELVRLGGRQDLLPQVEASTLRMVGKSVGVDRVLEEGDRVDLGNDVVLDVIHTPGHTPGSVSLYWEKERVLLTGDSVQGRGSRAGILPLYFLAEEYMRSQQRLLELPLELLCLGHAFGWSGPFNDPARRGEAASGTIRDALAFSQLIDRVVRAQLAAHPNADLLELAPLVVDELRYELPIVYDRQEGVPHRSLAPINAHLKAARNEE
ncbi:MAG TPA: MBL fold metallo-hydrolase [Chloroflexota bacterium]|nr:MBL fold metallo-hydrolase [Chloroflexota bacterium]